MQNRLLVVFPLVLTALLILASCTVDLGPPGPDQHMVKTIDRDKSDLVKVDLHMGVGEMRVEGGSKQLMEGDFTFNVPTWKPDVRYTNTGVRGYLSVEQPSTSNAMGNNRHSKWDLKLNDDVPMDFRVKFGVGEAQLNLGSLALRSVEVELGVGEIRLDLRGTPKRDYDVHVKGGIGEATIYLPSGVGIYANAHGGIGGIDARGLGKQGNHYESDNYEKAKVKINLDVKGGIGAIHLIADDSEKPKKNDDE